MPTSGGRGRVGAVLAVVVVVAAVAAVIVVGSGARSTLGDETFVAQANAVCARAAAARPAPASPGDSMAQRADIVEQSAGVLDAMVDELERLEVAAQDRAAVEAWLADWRETIAVGHRYADAIRAERPDLGEVADEGDASGMRIEEFARRNGLHACVF